MRHIATCFCNLVVEQTHTITRKHSSRMHNARLPTARRWVPSWGVPSLGGVPPMGGAILGLLSLGGFHRK